MSKFIKEEQTKEFKLSEYLEQDESAFKGCIFTDEARKKRTKYIMDILGDVSLDEETYKTFMKEFQCFGGRYDVRTKPDTIKGIYEITKNYPELTAEAIDEIWFIYIKDLFETYALTDMLGKIIERDGRTDATIQKYLDFVEKKAIEFDTPFVEDAKKLDIYIEEYGETFVKQMQYVMRSRHISSDNIINSLPESDLIKKDQKQLDDIARMTRIYMGMCLPISEQMIISQASGEGLAYYPEQPAYVISGGKTYDTTFTKQEFLDSIKKQATTSSSKKTVQYQKK